MLFFHIQMTNTQTWMPYTVKNQHYLGCIKQKSAFEHTQNAQIEIILRMCKV